MIIFCCELENLLLYLLMIIFFVSFQFSNSCYDSPHFLSPHWSSELLYSCSNYSVVFHDRVLTAASVSLLLSFFCLPLLSFNDGSLTTQGELHFFTILLPLFASLSFYSVPPDLHFSLKNYVVYSVIQWLTLIWYYQHVEISSPHFMSSREYIQRSYW